MDEEPAMRGSGGKQNNSQSATTKTEDVMRELNCSLEVICTREDMVAVVME